MAPTSSLNAAELTDEYFIENRNRILEIAAFLDRLDRDRKSTRLNSSHVSESRMPSSA